MQAVQDVLKPVEPLPSRQPTPPPKPATERYLALDAYRGFIMLMLCSGGFGLLALSNDPRFARPASWFDHVAWEGAVFWDIIQPAFMFMVGVAMPFALASRAAHGATFR